MRSSHATPSRWIALVLLVVGIVLAPEPQAEAAEQRAFTIADYYRTAFVGAPEVSPDGRLVAFAVRRYELESGQASSEIWLLTLADGDIRQMTRGKTDLHPLFSPDGRTLLFTSTRSGSSQLWTMPVDGGGPRQLTDFPSGVSDPVWSPDGRWIAVTSEVYAECGADPDCNLETSKNLSDGKLHVHVADELLYRHWNQWRDGRFRHVLLIDAESGQVVRDLTPGEIDSPTFTLGGTRGYDFSPDGTELVFVSNHDPSPASSTNSDLWLVPIDGSAEPINLTAGNAGWDGSPLFAPDGRSIAYLSQEQAGYESDLYRLAVYDRRSGESRFLTDGVVFDDWVDDMAWADDGESLVFQAQRQGRNPLFKTANAGGEISELLTHALISGWKLLPDGTGIVYTSRAVASPPEIFHYSLDATSAPRRVTHFNHELEQEVDIRPAEEIYVAGAGDHQVHVFIVKPHDFDPEKRYPLILNVHGGPQQAWMDSYRGDWQVYPGKGYVVAFANPTGSPSYGQDFVDAIGCDWGGRVYQDLMKVTEVLADLPYVDGERMGAMGWSYGGYMMMWMQGQTTRFKTLAAMMGLYDLPSFYGATEELWFPEKDLCGTPWESEDYKRWSPSTHVENFRTPSLVITGELDYRVPYTQSLAYFTALQKRGIPSRLVVYPNAGHWPSWYEMAFYYNLHLDWFHRWLGGEPAPWDVEDFARNRVFEEKPPSKSDGE